MTRRLAGIVVLATLAACRKTSDPEKTERAEGTAKSAASAETPAAEIAVPVRAAAARRATLERVVSAPGHTVALAQQRVRAPFAGTLVTLTRTDGDRVSRGEVVATIVSRDSEAALAGAREMQRSASTDTEKSDAARAIALAERDLVRTEIRAPVDGVVLSHGAAAGDRVSEDQEILTLANAGSVTFVSDVPQSDLAEIRPGQHATVELAGASRSVAGVVHGALPTANPADFTAPVRIDLPDGGVPLAVGLFGTARIAVAEKRDALVVPDAAILRDDVTGQARVALVRDGRVHWAAAKAGLRGAAGTELLEPTLKEGDLVVVAGQVGLPEGAAVAARP